MRHLASSKVLGYLLILTVALSGCGAGERSKRSGDDTERAELPPVESSDRIEKLWSHDVGDGTGSGYDMVAAYADGVVYAADPGGMLIAINGEDGDERWSVRVDEKITAGVGLGDGMVYVADREGRIRAFDAESGEARWSVNAGGEVLAPPVVSAATVIVRTVAGRVVGLRSSDGERRWAYQRTVPALSLRGTAPPAVYEGVALSSFASGKLVANEIESGTILWEYDVIAPQGRNEIDRMIDLDATPVLVGSVLYLAAFQGEVIALALGTQKVLWRKKVSSFRDIAADEDSIYVTADEGQVIALDRLTGEQKWSQMALRGYSDSGPTVIGDDVLVADADGTVHVLGRLTGELIGRLKTGSTLVGPVFSDGDRIYALLQDGRLFAFRRQPTG